MSADSRKVLTFGAVVGRGFGLDLLEAVGDVTGEALLTALEEAEANYLIMPMPGRAPRWEFSHALIRQTLAAGLSLPRRQRLHLKVADAIERAAGSNAEQYASDLAHHLFQAGTAVDSAKTVRFLGLAGDQALAAGAFDEALRQFNDALSIQDEADQRQIADLRYKKGRALRSLGRWEEAIAEWTHALSIYKEGGDRAAIAPVCWDMGYLMVWSARGKEAVEVARRGLEALGPEASADRCRLLAIGGWGLGNAAERADEVMAGDEMLSRSLAMAEVLRDPRAHQETLLASAYKHMLCMRSSEQAEAALRAAELLRVASDLWNMTDALALFQLASAFRGHLDGVARFEGETERLVQRFGNIGAEILALWARGQRDWMVAGDLDEFERFVERIVNLSATATPFVTIYETWRAHASLWRGRWEEARDRAQDVTRREPPGVMVGHHWSCFFLCECFLNHRETALDMLDERRTGLPGSGQANTAGAWTMLLNVIEGLALLRERKAAAALYPLALEAIETETVSGWDARRLLQTVAGIAAAAGGQWEQAETHYQMALRQAHEIPFRSEQPEARRWYAQMLLDRNASGDRDKARTLLGEAVEMYHTIGMPRHVEMAKERLKKT